MILDLFRRLFSKNDVWVGSVVELKNPDFYLDFLNIPKSSYPKYWIVTEEYSDGCFDLKIVSCDKTVIKGLDYIFVSHKDVKKLDYIFQVLYGKK